MKISILITSVILLFSCSNNQKTNEPNNNIQTPNDESKQAKVISEDLIKINILGTWISNDDKKSKLIFTKEFLVDIYDNEIIDTLSYVIENKESLLKTIDLKANIEFNYSIDYLTSKNLSLIYLERGNTLNYTKQN
jgi:hypothetical protein